MSKKKHVFMSQKETTNITEYDNYKTEISSLVGTG